MAELSNEKFAVHLQAARGSLMGLLFVLTADRSAAEDLFQETCLDAWRMKYRFVEGTDFGAWVRAIARIHVLRHRDSKGRFSLLPLSPEVIDRLGTVWAEREPAEEESPRRKALTLCMDRLEPAQRDLLQWRYRDGRSLQTIAGETGRSLGGVKMWLMRVKRKLEACLRIRLTEEA